MTIGTYTDSVYDAVREYVLANWTACRIRWPNEDFEEPRDGWIAFEIFGTSYGQQTFGMDEQTDNRWDEDGHI